MSSSSAVHRPSFGRGCTSRSYSAEVAPDRRTLRTVFRDTLRSRAISLIVLPLRKCSRRIRPIVSTVSIPPPPASNQSEQRIRPNGRGSILDADNPAQGVKIARRNTASADIPAATQLFTPNWIVKYLVQNTLGRQWLATYPDSPLRQQMEYYIEPAEQTEDVKAQLKAITPESLNPEELTLLDPACGSGHILVEAYDLL